MDRHGSNSVKNKTFVSEHQKFRIGFPHFGSVTLTPDDHVMSVLLYCTPLLSLFARLNPPDPEDFDQR